MIFDYTEEQERQFNEAQQKFHEKSITIQELLKVFNELEKKFEEEAFKELNNSPDAILQSAKEQIPKIIDFYSFPNFTLDDLKKAKEQNQYKIENGKFLLEINFVFNRVKEELSLHIEAFKDDPVNLSKLLELIQTELKNSDKTFGRIQGREKQSLFKPNMITFNSKPISKMASVTRSEMIIDTMLNTGEITADNLTLIFTKIGNVLDNSIFNVGTHKLLLTAISAFTIKNSKSNASNIDAWIDLKEYAYYCGHDVFNENPKKAKNALDNARKKVMNQLNTLYRLSFNWKDDKKNFSRCRVVQKVEILNGKIHIQFSNDFALSLSKSPQTYYPLALLGIDNKKAVAYSLGIKLAEHYNYDNNQRKKTANTISVKSLLNVTDLPSYESDTVKKHGWKERIKKPFEKALTALNDFEVLENWKYKEVTPIFDYQTWASSMIIFTLKDAPDHQTRLAKKDVKNNKSEGKDKG